MASFDAADVGVLLATCQAALAAKSSCIDSLQAGLAQQRQELALAWAATDKERQARGVAEDGVQALQWALERSQEQLRQEMGTRRADHHKLLAQLSCEWQVLEVLEEEQAKREAAEAALAMTQRWMQKTLLRCQHLQNQHRIQRQQIKAAQSERDAWWASWAQQAAAEHATVAQLCAQAEVDLPDFGGLLATATKEAPAKDARSKGGAQAGPCSSKGLHCSAQTAAKRQAAAAQSASLPASPRRGVSKQAGGFGSDCEGGIVSCAQPQCSRGGSSLSKSVSWSELGKQARAAPPAEEPPAGAAPDPEQPSKGASSRQASSAASDAYPGACSCRGSFHFTPTLQRQGGDNAEPPSNSSLPQSASKALRAPESPDRRAHSPPPDSKAGRGPNKTPHPGAAPVRPQDFEGLVARIVAPSVAPLGVTPRGPKACKADVINGASRVAQELSVPASKSAPTSPLRRACAAMLGPSQGLKDLTSNVVFQSNRKGSYGESGAVQAQRFRGQPLDAALLSLKDLHRV